MRRVSVSLSPTRVRGDLSLAKRVCDECAKIPWSDYAERRCICSGCNLDVGCGESKQKGYIGMDRRNVQGVDVVWDIESVAPIPWYLRKFENVKPEPWPIPSGVVDKLLMSHVMEHISPQASLSVMNELWRVMHWHGQLLMVVPHGSSFGFQQDPTHIKQINEAWVAYFDPQIQNGGLYGIYKPLPWRVARMHSNPQHSIELVLEPRKKPDGTPIVIYERTKKKGHRKMVGSGT